jgi:hypothetical protein
MQQTNNSDWGQHVGEQRTVGWLWRRADHKTSCNETCKCTTHPNESHGKKEEPQTMESDQIQVTATGWREWSKMGIRLVVQ